MQAQNKNGQNPNAHSQLGEVFRNSILETFAKTVKVQCSYAVTPGVPFNLSDLNCLSSDVVSTVKLSSNGLEGVVAIFFPKAVFLACFNSMLSESRNSVTTEITDCAAEIMNIVFGGAKTKLTGLGLSVQRVIPKVTQSAPIESSTFPKGSDLRAFPYTAKEGQFHIVICTWNPSSK